jgi:L-seryl-tRNA(Ser) seleniumtransferase
MSERQALLRQIPSIDRLLAAPPLQDLSVTCPHVLLREAAQQAVAEIRQVLLEGSSATPDCSVEAVAARAAELARIATRPSLRRVINVTGTLLHTNLGRAPLCETALQAIIDVSRGYSNLEYDLEAGKRGKRFTHVEQLVCRLTGAEAAHVVNNNAGAVLLALATLAGGKKALVSRGELIEIGGSFRIPEIMAAGGTRMVEVGTTNKTHLEDYRSAIDTETALILKVHTSNYRVLGFTEAVTGAELADLAHEHNLPVLEDLGSGLLLDLTPFGLPREPTVRETLAHGIDLVTFSGDKLLGGPQAGIIVGRREIVERLRKHPMARALRIDKMTLAALEATLQLYLDTDQAFRELPTLRMLSMPAAALHERCRRMLPRFQQELGQLARLTVITSTAPVGGGALPLAEMPGWVIACQPLGLSLNRLMQRLRRADVPVIGRVQDDQLLIDPRTLAEHEEDLLLQTLKDALTHD